MAFSCYVKDIDSNSLKESVFIKLKEGNNSGYTSAEIIPKKNTKKQDYVEIIEVENNFSFFEILEIEPYFCWIGTEVLSNGKTYRIAIRIKDSNFFEILKDSIIEKGKIKTKNFKVLFYRKNEVYFSPADNSSTMYKKALDLQIKLSDSKITEENNLKSGYVYRLKDGFLCVFLGKGKEVSFVKGDIVEKEIFVISKSKTTEYAQQNFYNLKTMTFKKNPCLEELGVYDKYKAKEELLFIKDIDSELVFSLFAEDFVHYIQDLPVQSVNENLKLIYNQLENNNHNKGLSIILQFLKLQHLKDSSTKKYESFKLTKENFEDFFDNYSDPLKVYIPWKEKLEISLKDNGKNKKNFYSSSEFPEIVVNENSLLIRDSYSSNSKVNYLLRGLLKLKEENLL